MPDTRVTHKIEKSPGLQKAIAAAGSVRRLAILLDVNPTAIRSWKGVPLHRVLEIEDKLAVPREITCPELFVGFRRIKHRKPSNCELTDE
jgi:hypothetical protein